jgi:hypothetical protein
MERRPSVSRGHICDTIAPGCRGVAYRISVLRCQTASDRVDVERCEAGRQRRAEHVDDTTGV